MKKVLLFSLLMLFAGSVAFAQGGIKFENSTFKSILAKAKAQKKLVFVDVYASWCGPCKRMASDVFPQKKVGDYFNSTFINAKFDAEQGEGVEVAKRFGVRSYPTFLLLNGDGDLVGKLIGGNNADDFIKDIKALVAKVPASSR